MSSLQKRLSSKLEEKRISQEELANMIGASQAAVSKIILGETKRSRFLPKIAESLGVSEQWLLYGEESSNAKILDSSVDEWDNNTPLPPTMVKIPFLNGMSLSAGVGALNSDAPYDGAVLWFAKSFIRRSGACLDRVFCISVVGDSMKPKYEEGGIVVVDSTNALSLSEFNSMTDEQKSAETLSRITDGKVYAINYKGQDYIKRLGRDGSKVRIISDNPSYSTKEEPAHFVHIFGRVIAYQRED